MALIGVSLIVASVVLYCLRRPVSVWFPRFLSVSGPGRLGLATSRNNNIDDVPTEEIELDQLPPIDDHDNKTMNKAPATINLPTLLEIPPPTEPEAVVSPILNSTEQTTPKATPTLILAASDADADTDINGAVPALSLSAPDILPPSPPSQPTITSTTMAPPPLPSISKSSSLMPPPPRPPTLRPTSSPSSSSSLLPPARPSPIPARGPGCSTLAPPPTHSSKPAKPSRAVVLSPGHSPLDWARLSGDPRSDLRGLPPGTPYLRVTPSALRRMTGRRGKDAWTALGGKVYNLSPYLPFHPGGEPELLRCAGRVGDKLFGEIHPWVNYENMLAACVVGIYVSEEEGAGQGRAGTAGGGGAMEEMD